MSLLLQGPSPLLEAEVVLGDLHDPLYQLRRDGGGVERKMSQGSVSREAMAAERLHGFCLSGPGGRPSDVGSEEHIAQKPQVCTLPLNLFQILPRL